LLLNGRRRKNILLESDLEEKIKYHSFLNYFKNAAVESKKCTSLTTNAKLAFQIPYLASSLAMGKINGWNACTELFKKERQKNKISIFQANENNADLYYNLACFYSMVSHIDNFSEYTLPILRRFFYQRDDKLIIKYPTNYSEIALRNIEKAFDCDYRIAPNIINDPCFEALQVDYASEFEKIKTKHSKILLEPQNDKKDTANIEVGGHQDTTLSLSPLALNIALGLNKEPLETILEVIEKENESQSENEDFNKKAEYFFELASFYSLISCSMAIKKPNQFADLGLRSLEIALQCNPKRILALVDLDAWLDNIRENNRGEYDAIIQKYSILDNTIHPKDKKSAKKSDES
jgi:hypothetical protein